LAFWEGELDFTNLLMKILFANKFFYLNGGSETVFFQERNFLKEQGAEVIDFSMQDERNLPSEFSDYFVPHVDYSGERRVTPKLKTAVAFIHSREGLKRLTRLMEKEKPQIAHLHNIYHQLTPSIIPLLKEKGAKVVLTLHDAKLVCPAYLMLNRGKICVQCEGEKFYKAATTRCQGSFGKGVLLAAEAYWHKWRKSYEYVDRFISPSKFLADLVTTYRVPAGRIRVLKNGIDADDFVPGSEDGGYGLYFGRISPEKGVKTLLAAHAAMDSRIPLKIVGSGPLEENLKSCYPDAEFLGYKRGDELRSIVGNASFVVVPSECYENCSMTILEAMALARPVIGSRIGGIPEQVEDGVTGLLFEMGSAAELAEKMDQLWQNRSLRRLMGKAARSKLEREYSLKKHLDGLMRIYRELLEGPA